MNDSIMVEEPPLDREEIFCVGRTTASMFDRDVLFGVAPTEPEGIQIQNIALRKWKCIICVINPRYACAARVTVVGCLCVCPLVNISCLERLFVL